MINPIQTSYFETAEPELELAISQLISVLPSKQKIVSLVFFGNIINNSYHTTISSIRNCVAAHFTTLPLISFIPQPTLGVSSYGLEVNSLNTLSESTIDFKKFNSTSYALIDLQWGKSIWVEGLSADCISEQYTYQGLNIFSKLTELLHSEGFEPHQIVRQWNYIGNIVDFENGNQHYQLFNNARTKFYEQDNFVYGFPAATGISISTKCLLVSLIAVKPSSETRIIPIDNTLQIPAYKYSDSVLVDGKTEHLKSSPKFERAKVLISNKQCTIFVSGTAAIRNEKSSHIDNVSLQTIETIANINYLISSGNLKNNGWQVKSEAKLTSIRVYVKNKNDFEIVKLEVEKAWPAIQSIYLEAEVCRPELLVEIEGIAEIQI